MPIINKKMHFFLMSACLSALQPLDFTTGFATKEE